MPGDQKVAAHERQLTRHWQTAGHYDHDRQPRAEDAHPSLVNLARRLLSLGPHASFGLARATADAAGQTASAFAQEAHEVDVLQVSPAGDAAGPWTYRRSSQFAAGTLTVEVASPV